MRRIDAALVPQLAVPEQITNRDYRRIVLAIAGAAVLFFVPSLILAGVPAALWIPFCFLAVAVAVWVSATFLSVPRGSPLALLTPITNGFAIALIGVAFRPYYHSLDLLYPLIVSGHAIVHGIGPGLIAVAVGTIVVTFALHDPGMANWSDIFYAALYLCGSALLPWTAWRLAGKRGDLLARLRHESEGRRARLETILRSMDDAVMVVERGGRIALTNAAYDTMVATMGGSIEPLDERGRRLHRSRSPQARAARGDSFEMSFTLIPPHAERRWYEARGGPIGDGLGFAGGVVVVRDITDRSLRSQQEDFMATASHELRTPIAALHGYVQLLARRLDPALQPREAEFARVALSQTRRVGLLLDRLLDLARLQGGGLEVERQPVELVAVVRRAMIAAEQSAPDHVIRLEAPAASPTVKADPGRLEQVLLNLLTNAVQHAPQSKRIDIRIGVADGRASVTVRDYGPGIPSRRLSRLFGRRGNPASAAGRYRGLGLGLFISRELMRAQRGSIEISSEPGAGTIATIHLPIAHEGRAGTGDAA